MKAAHTTRDAPSIDRDERLSDGVVRAAGSSRRKPIAFQIPLNGEPVIETIEDDISERDDSLVYADCGT